MRALVALADRVLVMHHGAQLFLGTPAEMLRDQRVIEVYLGRAARRGTEAPRERVAPGRTPDRRPRPQRRPRDLSLAVNAGQTAVVIGPNGHGKTTLLMAISGLLKPMAGEIPVDGKRVDGVAAESPAAASSTSCRATACSPT